MGKEGVLLQPSACIKGAASWLTHCSPPARSAKRCPSPSPALAQRRLAEIAPATATDPSIAAAEREARILLGEVDSMFFSS